jgi:hypothetical protein
MSAINCYVLPEANFEELFLTLISKMQSSLALNYTPRHEDVLWSGGLAQSILNLITESWN